MSDTGLISCIGRRTSRRPWPSRLVKDLPLMIPPGVMTLRGRRPDLGGVADPYEVATSTVAGVFSWNTQGHLGH
jgi:hypothetical protein